MHTYKFLYLMIYLHTYPHALMGLCAYTLCNNRDSMLLRKIYIYTLYLGISILICTHICMYAYIYIYIYIYIYVYIYYVRVCVYIYIYRNVSSGTILIAITWRFMGSYKWSYKSPKIAYNKSYSTFNPTYNYP